VDIWRRLANGGDEGNAARQHLQQARLKDPDTEITIQLMHRRPWVIVSSFAVKEHEAKGVC
jgi:hypothetical protein